MDDDFLDDILSETESDNSNDASDNSDTDDINLEVENENNTLIESKVVNLPNTWSLIPPVSREPVSFIGNNGVKVNLSNSQNPREIFEKFFDEDLMKYIVEQTNKYAAKVTEEKRRSGKTKKKSRDLLWCNTNI